MVVVDKFDNFESGVSEVVGSSSVEVAAAESGVVASAVSPEAIISSPINTDNETNNKSYSVLDMFTGQISSLGDFASFCGYTFIWLCWRRPRWEVLAHSFYTIGVLSLPVVMLTGMFIGMVLAVQTYSQFKAIGMEAVLGGVISFSLVRELGPVLAATMLAGRVGSSIAAEIGSMRVSEQIEALASLGTSPIHYLVVPRFMASLFLIPALTVIADFMGVFGGAIYCTKILGIDDHFYWEHGRSLVGPFDVLAGMFKSVFFGGIIALISCYQGFRCEDGAEGVGKAATQSFVLSFVAILFIDLILGIFIDRVQSILGFPTNTLGGSI
ncbi:MAG: ABC transporter permease [Planctomycetaceae bacterium]|jgi:phospholipid/cholesterol/gamma-HCH transport system permease protein|nr:ABC transporter permease [Planctomycetaceae bacterium]